ncbi:hypothetical protein GEMRC1_005734 [Eukaryota sp. GEM-RC1]
MDFSAPLTSSSTPSSRFIPGLRSAPQSLPEPAEPIDEAARLTSIMQTTSTPTRKPLDRGQQQRVLQGPPPPNYRCYKCNIPGHWIQFCPHDKSTDGEQKPQYKAPIGIPRNFLKKASEDIVASSDSMENETKGGYKLPSGDVAVLTPNDDAFQRMLGRKAPPAVNIAPKSTVEPEPSTEEFSNVPSDYCCTICTRIMNDPHAVQCCGHSFCRACITNALNLDPNRRCPVCRRAYMGDNAVFPNRNLASIIEKWKGADRGVSVEAPVEVKPQPEQKVVPLDKEVSFIGSIVETMIKSGQLDLPEIVDSEIEVFLADSVRAARVSMVSAGYQLEDPSRPIELTSLGNYDYLIEQIKKSVQKVESPPQVVRESPPPPSHAGTSRLSHDQHLPPPKQSREDYGDYRYERRYSREEERSPLYRRDPSPPPRYHRDHWKTNPRYDRFRRMLDIKYRSSPSPRSSPVDDRHRHGREFRPRTRGYEGRDRRRYDDRGYRPRF